MVGLLDGDIDAAEAMTYNEYAQVLEAVNPDTGELYTPEDFNVISYEEVGVGMLQDAIWADAGRLEPTTAYRDIATRFVAASIEGWAYCRDNPEACRDIVVAAGSQLGDSHQLWQMNEINKLIWPADERHRLHRRGGLGPHRRDRPEHAEPRRRDGADGAADRGRLHQRHRRGGAARCSATASTSTGEDFEPIEVTLEPRRRLSRPSSRRDVTSCRSRCSPAGAHDDRAGRRQAAPARSAMNRARRVLAVERREHVVELRLALGAGRPAG